MHSKQSFRDWLRRFPFITEADWLHFEPALEARRYRAKSFFLTEGEVCSKMAFVAQGCFRKFHLTDKKEITSFFNSENDVMVEFDSYLNRTPSRYSIQAVEDSEIVSFSRSSWQDAFDRSKNWERLGRITAERYYVFATRRMERFLFLTGEERYKDFIAENPKLMTRVPLYQIASYLGLEPESLSRLRRKIHLPLGVPAV